jgi:preprotein translocase SecE subunit
MASVTKAKVQRDRDDEDNDGENIMATDAVAPGATGAEEPQRDQERAGRQPPQQSPQPPQQQQRADKSAERPGFFTIHQKGQGYWTRLLSALGAALLIVLTAQFLWEQLPVWIRPAFLPDVPTAQQNAAAEIKARNITLGVCAAVVVGLSLLTWRMMNKPANVDFLIATDSEMKKVNWTSRKELVGSTKVVIFFMLVIAAALFVIDILFGYVFHWIRVLKAPPL